MVGLHLSIGRKKFKDGRHVGLDFYDLLIEGFRNRWSDSAEEPCKRYGVREDLAKRAYLQHRN
jgi:hypothetical protein